MLNAIQCLGPGVHGMLGLCLGLCLFLLVCLFGHLWRQVQHVDALVQRIDQRLLGVQVMSVHFQPLQRPQRSDAGNCGGLGHYNHAELE